MARPDWRPGRARWLVAALLLAWAPPAAAQPAPGEREQRASELAREGNQLADAGRFDEAIARWKQAEQLDSRLLHPCNIGLAYARSARPARAHLFLRLCRERALRDAVSVPDWVDARLARVEAELGKGGFGQVRVSARDAAGVRVTLSPALADDESFELPRTVWLPAGRHQLTAQRAGRPVASRAVEVAAGSMAEIELEIAAAPAPAAGNRRDLPAARRQTTAPGARTSRWGLLLVGAGALALGGGGLMHYLALGTADDARALPPVPPGTAYPEYDDLLARFRRQRALALGLYGAGALAAAAGTYLLLRSPSGSERAQVTVQATGAGAAVGVAGVW